MGLSIYHIRKKKLLPFVVDPFSPPKENKTKLHKLVNVYICVRKCMSKGLVKF